GIAISGAVRSSAGAPLAGALVTVYDLTQGAVDPNGSVETRAFTDPAGAYVVAHASPGMKKIEASSEGRATQAVSGVAVEPGKPPTKIDLVRNGGAEISGRVASSEGAPVAGAWVTARLLRIAPKTDGSQPAPPDVPTAGLRRDSEPRTRDRAVETP